MNCQPDYKNSPKNIWRNKWWKSAARRCRELSIPPNQARVVYQPGANDLDRRVAIRHGFRAQNLIGIDRDSDLCRDLRKKNVTMIHGDVIDVLCAWNPDNLPHVVLLDTCSVISSHFSKLFATFRAGNFYNRRMVWGINVQHGRDPFINSWRETYARSYPADLPVLYNPRRNLTAPPEYIRGNDGDNDKPTVHRGLAMLNIFVEQCLRMLGFLPFQAKTDICTSAYYTILYNMDAELAQYQSEGANVKMDSVMFNWAQFVCNKNGDCVAPKRIAGYSKKAANKIAAGLATGTIQQRKRLAV